MYLTHPTNACYKTEAASFDCNSSSSQQRQQQQQQFFFSCPVAPFFTPRLPEDLYFVLLFLATFVVVMMLLLLFYFLYNLGHGVALYLESPQAKSLMETKKGVCTFTVACVCMCVFFWSSRDRGIARFEEQSVPDPRLSPSSSVEPHR